MTEAERLAKFLDRINDIMGETAYGAGLREAAAELRRLSGYEAEAKAGRRAFDSTIPKSYEEETRNWYMKIRTANEANEPPPITGSTVAGIVVGTTEPTKGTP